MTKKTVEVCFSPVLYEYKLTRENFITVVVDILRAGTSICAAMDHGVKEIIPVGSIEEAKEYKNKGYYVACERNGEVLDFADTGNSPSDFRLDSFKKSTIAFSTTNGTKAIHLAYDAEAIAVGAFVNLTALSNWLKKKNKNVVILCAAWKNLFNLEDSVFAGALAEKMLESDNFRTDCDSALAAIELWTQAKKGLPDYLSRSSHRNRLKHLVSKEDYMYTVSPDSTSVVPVYRIDRLVNILS